MARGQYDLPLNRVRPTYGPQRPPVQVNRSASSASYTRPSPQQRQPVVLFLSPPGSASLKSQIIAIQTTLTSDTSIQVVETAEAVMTALSQKPSAVIVPDNALSEPAFERARPELLRYAQNGGRLVTDLSQSSMGIGASTPREFSYTDQHVDHSMRDSIELRTDDLMT